MITSKIGHSHPLDIITKLNKTERGKMRKNIITLSLENIKSFSKNITSHFTGKAKITTLSFAIIMLSFVNIINTSALSYQSSVGIGFTFNPTLSVSISPSNLTIDNLTPGTASDSNTINVSVATNAAYGYTLSAIMNSNNSDLTHTNGTNVFSSIATNASLSSLTTDNTWGYSYKNNLESTPTWSSYSGLSNSASKVLFNTDSNSGGSIDFKIAAKASSTQPSGTYTGTINFTAVTKPKPKEILDLEYLQDFADLDEVNLASVKSSMILNSAYILKDIRDDKEYYVARLEDGNVWMTQNLDLDLDSTRTYTHYDTDLGRSNPSNPDINVTWNPIHSTIDFAIGSAISGWQNSNIEPYSANPGSIYYYTSNSNANDVQYDSLQECINAGYNDCAHYHAGNYYNWTAIVASNNSSNIVGESAPNSICPAGWRLPKGSDGYAELDYGDLFVAYGVISKRLNTGYKTRGFNILRETPLYYVRAGYIDNNRTLFGNKQYGFYRYGNYSSTLSFGNGDLQANNNLSSVLGLSVRCLAR